MQLTASNCFALFTILLTIRFFLEPFIKPRAPKESSAGKRGALSLGLLTLPYLVSGIAAAAWLHRDAEVCGTSFLLGIVLVTAGTVGRIWSLRTMGSSYSVFIDPTAGGGLVTTGAYRFVRHPVYSLYCLESLGLLLVRPNPISLACLLAIAGAAVYRAGIEDRLLRERFGAEAVEYQGRTKRFIPLVY